MTRTTVRSVYVHAPFCARRCSYCDFAVTVRRSGDLVGWAEALTRELRAIRREGLFDLADALESLYVGGGTPSLLGPAAMKAVADVVDRDRLRGAGLEWTSEANPESLTAEVADGWSRDGVNRLSLGVQTFHEAALRWMGRLHGPEGAIRAVRMARAAGIDNVSVDLIFGLPRALGRSWRDDLLRALELDVPHISLYGLTVEAATPLGRAVAEGREPAVDDEQYREEFLLASELLAEAGYHHYEVSNFARPGMESRHNIGYWSGVPYLGLGNGAHSYAHPVRRWNVRGWEDYRSRLAEGGTADDGREELDEAATRLERIWLGLRTSRGLDLAVLRGCGGDVVDGWVTGGLAARSGGIVRLTPRGWLVLDRLCVELDSAVGGHGGGGDTETRSRGRAEASLTEVRLDPPTQKFRSSKMAGLDRSEIAGTDLTERERQVLEAVVRTYVDTAEPAGSRTVSRSYDLGVSAATVRNTMSDLEEKGYLFHPHTSAGRVPTDLAYRFFVDRLMEPAEPSAEELASLEREIGRTSPSPVDRLIRQAARVLSVISNELGVALAPSLEEAVLERLELIQVSTNKVLLVATIGGGVVRTIYVDLPIEIPKETLLTVTVALNERLSGLSLHEIRRTLPQRLRDSAPDEAGAELINIFMQSGAELFDVSALDASQLHLGNASVLAAQPEFETGERMKRLIDLTEQRDLLAKAVGNREHGGHLKITIGGENDASVLTDFTLVTAEYSVGGLKGVVGVIGPTRMPYEKVVTIVDYTSSLVTRVLTT